MPRRSQAEQARRRKHRAARGGSWIPEPVFEQLVAADETADAIGAAVADVDGWIADRGWILDTENGRESDDLVSWVYPPSAVPLEDDRGAGEDREPVT